MSITKSLFLAKAKEDVVVLTNEDYYILHTKVNDYYNRTKSNELDFDMFMTMMEDWFAFTGAIKFTTDKIMRSKTAMTEEAKNGFHQIIKAFFCQGQFQIASTLIELGKNGYQDIENSILDMNTKGKFSQSSMSDKSDSLERSKDLLLTFSQVLDELSPHASLDHIQNGLNHILEIFDVLDHIVIFYELEVIKNHIHSIFG